MAIEAGNLVSINNMAGVYIDNKEYDEGIKYILMAVEKGNMSSMEKILTDDKTYEQYKIDLIIKLFKYHKHIFDHTQYVEALLYYIGYHAYHKDICDELLKIIDYIDIKYFTKCSKLLLLTKKLLLEKINLIDLHFYYSPDNIGCQEARQDFLERLT